MKNKENFPTKELKAAFEHIKTIHPDLSIAIFDKNGQWCYMDESFEAFTFDTNIDVSLLEAASDSIETLPFIYQH